MDARFSIAAVAFFYWVCGTVLFGTHASYFFWGLFFLTLAFIGAAVSPADSGARIRGPKQGHLELLFCFLAFSGLALLAFDDGLIYTRDFSARRWLDSILWLCLGASAVRMAMAYFDQHALRRERASRILDWILIGLLLVAQGVSLRASPQPHIDVFTVTTSALDHFLRFTNPYGKTYEDIYHGLYNWPSSFSYWPGLLFFLAPFRVIFGDFRWAYIFSHLLIVVGLRRLGRNHGADPALTRAGILAWLCFPVTYFVLEQAWIDTLLILGAVWSFAWIKERRFFLVGFCVGSLCAIKQYGFLFGALELFYIASAHGSKAARRYAIAAATTFCVLVVPFVILDWKSLYQDTVLLFLKQPFRRDSFSWPAFWIRNYGFVPGRGLVDLTFLGVLAWALRRVIRSAGHHRLEGLASAIVCLYGFVFLFVKNAHCNYYYFVAFFALLQLIHTAAPPIGANRRIELV